MDRQRPPQRSCRVLCIQGTGKGKSILYQTLAAHFGKVTVYISPLLTLGADQVNKLMGLTRVIGYTIIPIQLDSVKTKEEIAALSTLINGIQDGISVVIYTSPQTLTDRFPKFVESICQHISFVVVDELHMFNDYGRSFRVEFQRLRSRLFRQVSARTPMLFLTASCNARIRSSFEKMIGLKMTHVHWPYASEIANRRVSLHSSYSQKPWSKVSKLIVELLKTDSALPNKVIVYSNVRHRVQNIEEKLGNLFDGDDLLHQFEALAVHGTLTKEEKSAYIQMFLDPKHRDDLKIKVLCATSGVGNVGLDSREIRSVYRLEFPPSVIDFVQECGRAGRVNPPDPLNFSYHVNYSLESFLYLYERVMDPEQVHIDPDYCKDEVENLFEVARMLVLQQECYYVAIENHLGNPNGGVVNRAVRPCNNFCPVCRDDVKDRRVTPIVNRDGLTSVLFNIFNPQPSNSNVSKDRKNWTLSNLVSEVRDFPDASLLITRSSAKDGLSPDSIKRILFCLLVKGIMKLNYHSGEKAAVFSLAHSRREHGTFALRDDDYWVGIELKN